MSNEEVAGNPAQPIAQHVVSRVLLKRFAAPGGRTGGWEVVRFDLNHPERPHKRKSPKACGYVKDFVRLDSASMEARWQEVERRVPEALAAVEEEEALVNSSHAETLRDLMALHIVRSHRFHKVHREAYLQTYQSLRQHMLQRYPEQLRAEALRETGLFLTGPEALAAYLNQIMEQSVPARDHVSGRLFRTSIEEMFDKVRAMLAKSQLEIVIPGEGEFLLGDSPAIPLRHSNGTKTYHVAIGDATTVVLPISPKRLVSLGPESVIRSVSKAAVDELNFVQVVAAYRNVFFRPDSDLEPFVKSICRYRAPSSHSLGQASQQLT